MGENKVYDVDFFNGCDWETYFTFVSGKRMLYRTVFGNWDNGTLLV